MQLGLTMFHALVLEELGGVQMSMEMKRKR
jgi:hypothetical protein